MSPTGARPTPDHDLEPLPESRSSETVRIAAEAADSRKAIDLKVLDLEGLSDFADWFLVCSGSSERQVQAIADAVTSELREAGVRPLHVEGQREGQWVLLDYGDVLVHVFEQERRDFYRLERLWADAPDRTADFVTPAPVTSE